MHSSFEKTLTEFPLMILFATRLVLGSRPVQESQNSGATYYLLFGLLQGRVHDSLIYHVSIHSIFRGWKLKSRGFTKLSMRRLTGTGAVLESVDHKIKWHQEVMLLDASCDILVITDLYKICETKCTLPVVLFRSLNIFCIYTNIYNSS